ncbi:MAG: hypothetical protein QOJ81_334 [Chloroflexota bacterium]|nr:hypothetical protein [Chloroflexota bacterium]
MADAVVAPEPQTEADKELERLAAERFAALMTRYPVYATYLGLHEHDGELGDASREALLADTEQTRRFLDTLERMDATSLSAYYATERELALFVTRRDLFDADVHRVWERRASASDEIGDGIFLLFARGGRPLAERLEAIAGRLEAAPHYLDESRTRFGERAPVRLWNETELDAIESMPTLFDDVAGAARREFGESHTATRRIEKGIAATRVALDTYAAWLKEEIGRGTDEFAMGGADYDTLVGLRAFDGLSADDILEVGKEQLAAERAARQEVAREIDPSASEQEVVDRVKSEHATDFPGALEEYRAAMAEARQFIVDHNLATIPPTERLKVIETPEYMRGVIPFAAYFSPGKFEPGRPEGIYVVTPSIDGDARAMREHNHASIYNTSIHEAYPGHHLQLVVANQHPSLIRLLVDAPEFVEGWAMYCELMMREQGFDTAPSHRLMMHTDAIWRACRIILDVRLQRGEIGVDEAVDFMVEQTGFERPQAAAEVKWYTYRPTYPLSYLLGRQLLLRLKADEEKRLGSSFSLRGFHDALLNQGGLPISYHRRLLAQSA